MNSEREPLLTDALFILVGVLGIFITIGSLGNNIEYLPSDVRSQPWFDPLVSSIMVVVSLFSLIVGTIRLLQGLRDRDNKQR